LTATLSASPILLPPRPALRVSTVDSTVRKNERSGVSGHTGTARPANAINPTRVSSSLATSSPISALARARRVGGASSASIERDTSSTNSTSADVCVTSATSVSPGACGRMIAPMPHSSARKISPSLVAVRASVGCAVSRRCMTGDKNAAIAPRERTSR